MAIGPLEEAFVLISPLTEGFQAKLEAQTSAAVAGVESTLVAGGAEAGSAAGTAAGEGIATGVAAGGQEAVALLTEELAAGGVGAGTAAGVAIGEGVATGTGAGVTSAREEIVVGIASAGETAGAEAGAGIFEGIRIGSAAGAAALRGEMQAAGIQGGGAFGTAFSRAAPQLVVAAAVTFGVVKALQAFIGAAEEAEAVDAKLGAAVERNALASTRTTRSYIDQATALQSLTGYEDESIKSADAILARFSLTGQQIQEIIPLVLDYASATGKSVPSAAESVGKALLGQTRALKTLGINYTSTGDRAQDFDNILGLLQDRIGGLAEKEMDTLRGQTRLLGSEWDDLKENLGRVFIPPLTLAFKALNLAIEPVSVSLGKQIQEMEQADPAYRAVQQQVVALESNLSDLAAQLQNGAISTSEYRSGLRETVSSLRDAGVAEEDLTNLRRAGLDFLAQYIRGLGATASAHSKAAAAARAQLTAELELGGSALGVAAAQRQLQDSQEGLVAAEHQLTHLQERNKKGTDVYRDALKERRDQVASVADAVFALVGAENAYEQKQGETNIGERKIEAALRESLGAYDLTREQVRLLSGEIEHGTRSANAFAKTYTAHFRADGVTNVIHQLDVLYSKAGVTGALLARIASGNYAGTPVQGPTHTMGPPSGNTSNPNTPKPSPQAAPPRNERRAIDTHVTQIVLDGKTIESVVTPVQRRHTILMSGRRNDG